MYMAKLLHGALVLRAIHFPCKQRVHLAMAGSLHLNVKLIESTHMQTFGGKFVNRTLYVHSALDSWCKFIHSDKSKTHA